MDTNNAAAQQSNQGSSPDQSAAMGPVLSPQDVQKYTSHPGASDVVIPGMKKQKHTKHKNAAAKKGMKAEMLRQKAQKLDSQAKLHGQKADEAASQLPMHQVKPPFTFNSGAGQGSPAGVPAKKPLTGGPETMSASIFDRDALNLAGDWDESQHPRDDHGRFGEGAFSEKEHSKAAQLHTKAALNAPDDATAQLHMKAEVAHSKAANAFGLGASYSRASALGHKANDASRAAHDHEEKTTGVRKWHEASSGDPDQDEFMHTVDVPKLDRKTASDLIDKLHAHKGTYKGESGHIDVGGSMNHSGNGKYALTVEAFSPEGRAHADKVLDKHFKKSKSLSLGEADMHLDQNSGTAGDGTDKIHPGLKGAGGAWAMGADKVTTMSASVPEEDAAAMMRRLRSHPDVSAVMLPGADGHVTCHVGAFSASGRMHAEKTFTDTGCDWPVGVKDDVTTGVDQSTK